MTRLTYRDAVKILGAGNSPVVQALDRIFGGLLLGALPLMPDLRSFFGIKGELSRLINELVTSGIDKRRKLTQFNRIQRLHAARGVLMVTAYFDALEREELPFRLDALRISRKDAMGLSGSRPDVDSLAAITKAVLQTELPVLGLHTDTVRAQAELTRFYRGLGTRVDEFFQRLSVWDTLNDTRRSHVSGALQLAVSEAMRLFDASIQQLAEQCPEFAIWLNISGHSATHDRLEGVHRAVQDLLSRAEPVQHIAPALQAVVRFNRETPGRKLVAIDELPDGLDSPMIDRAYVNPHFRMSEVDASVPVNSEDFWSSLRVREDFEKFLLGYLSTPWAWCKPLVVLGHPGAGKSLLTEVYSASLPSPDFVSVRVPLRDVPAEAEVHEQIEQAIRLATHESVSWAEFARSAGESLLVVFLDGFDELLQATGVSKSDYLVRVCRFQRIEATQGRHVAIVVTSRVTVADRMRLPGNVAAVRLEPFSVDQIGQWLDVWNATNGDYLAGKGRSRLGESFIKTYQELASQPLLLLMLAIYDAESGALHNVSGRLSRTELYERLLDRFAYRQVRKRSRDGLADSPAVDREIMILSIVALGMFNRGAQWVTDAQLAEDLTALRITPSSQEHITAGHRRLAGEAKNALGRFFFVHRARTSVDDVELGTYEFLHATFGEYLVVRLIWRCLDEMIHKADRESTSLFPGKPCVDDAELRAFTSWSLLSVRTTTIEFLAELVARWPASRRARLRGMLLAVFRAVHQPEVNTAYRGYSPAGMTPTARLATYSANLLVLIMAVGSELTSKELYVDSVRHLDEWVSTMLLLQSQLKPGEWDSLTKLYQTVRRGSFDERVAYLRHRGRGSDLVRPFRLSWPYSPRDRKLDRNQFPATVFRTAEIVCDLNLDIVVNAIGGPESLLAEVISEYVPYNGELRSVAGDLVAASLFNADNTATRDRMVVYERIVRFARTSLSYNMGWSQRLAAQVCHLLVVDDAVPARFVLDQLNIIREFSSPVLWAHNLKLLLVLLPRLSNHETFLEMLDDVLRGKDISFEQAVELWCTLVEKGISAARLPVEIRAHHAALSQPGGEERLAHRPDLLRRLVVLGRAERG
ncbi:NACHT domain-containing protein [Amycolatopsis samaneae]|uniref:NACHT domain-containing protein n=1 Tax=Amycolatopsis samaneae TaxID=664691 RepID=A0ABW5GC15_9PSEU